MKKTVVHVPFDEEKLSAARLYMAQKELSFEEEMEKELLKPLTVNM